jgi:hypothetical protein
LQGIKISGNPLLGAYVTELSIEVGEEEASSESLIEVTAVRDNDFTGEQNATTIVTYRLAEVDVIRSTRHLFITPIKWVGPKPCLRFEVFYF